MVLVVEGEESWEKGGRELRVEENFGKALGVDLRQWGKGVERSCKDLSGRRVPCQSTAQ